MNIIIDNNSGHLNRYPFRSFFFTKLVKSSFFVSPFFNDDDFFMKTEEIKNLYDTEEIKNLSETEDLENLSEDEDIIKIITPDLRKVFKNEEYIKDHINKHQINNFYEKNGKFLFSFIVFVISYYSYNYYKSCNECIKDIFSYLIDKDISSKITPKEKYIIIMDLYSNEDYQKNLIILFDSHINENSLDVYSTQQQDQIYNNKINKNKFIGIEKDYLEVVKDLFIEYKNNGNSLNDSKDRLDYAIQSVIENIKIEACTCKCVCDINSKNMMEEDKLLLLNSSIAVFVSDIDLIPIKDNDDKFSIPDYVKNTDIIIDTKMNEKKYIDIMFKFKEALKKDKTFYSLEVKDNQVENQLKDIYIKESLLNMESKINHYFLHYFPNVSFHIKKIEVERLILFRKNLNLYKNEKNSYISEDKDFLYTMKNIIKKNKGEGTEQDEILKSYLNDKHSIDFFQYKQQDILTSWIDEYNKQTDNFKKTNKDSFEVFKNLTLLLLNIEKENCQPVQEFYKKFMILCLNKIKNTNKDLKEFKKLTNSVIAIIKQDKFLQSFSKLIKNSIKNNGTNNEYNQEKKSKDINSTNLFQDVLYSNIEMIKLHNTEVNTTEIQKNIRKYDNFLLDFLKKNQTDKNFFIEKSNFDMLGDPIVQSSISKLEIYNKEKDDILRQKLLLIPIINNIEKLTGFNKEKMENKIVIRKYLFDSLLPMFKNKEENNPFKIYKKNEKVSKVFKKNIEKLEYIKKENLKELKVLIKNSDTKVNEPRFLEILLQKEMSHFIADQEKKELKELEEKEKKLNKKVVTLKIEKSILDSKGEKLGKLKKELHTEGNILQDKKTILEENKTKTELDKKRLEEAKTELEKERIEEGLEKRLEEEKNKLEEEKNTLEEKKNKLEEKRLEIYNKQKIKESLEKLLLKKDLTELNENLIGIKDQEETILEIEKVNTLFDKYKDKNYEEFDKDKNYEEFVDFLNLNKKNFLINKLDVDIKKGLIDTLKPIVEPLVEHLVDIKKNLIANLKPFLELISKIKNPEINLSVLTQEELNLLNDVLNEENLTNFNIWKDYNYSIEEDSYEEKKKNLKIKFVGGLLNDPLLVLINNLNDSLVFLINNINDDELYETISGLIRVIESFSKVILLEVDPKTKLIFNEQTINDLKKELITFRANLVDNLEIIIKDIDKKKIESCINEINEKINKIQNERLNSINSSLIRINNKTLTGIDINTTEINNGIKKLEEFKIEISNLSYKISDLQLIEERKSHELIKKIEDGNIDKDARVEKIIEQKIEIKEEVKKINKYIKDLIYFKDNLTNNLNDKRIKDIIEEIISIKEIISELNKATDRINKEIKEIVEIKKSIVKIKDEKSKVDPIDFITSEIQPMVVFIKNIKEILEDISKKIDNFKDVEIIEKINENIQGFNKKIQIIKNISLKDLGDLTGLEEIFETFTLKQNFEATKKLTEEIEKKKNTIENTPLKLIKEAIELNNIIYKQINIIDNNKKIFDIVETTLFFSDEDKQTIKAIRQSIKKNDILKEQNNFLKNFLEKTVNIVNIYDIEYNANVNVYNQKIKDEELMTTELAKNEDGNADLIAENTKIINDHIKKREENGKKIDDFLIDKLIEFSNLINKLTEFDNKISIEMNEHITKVEDFIHKQKTNQKEIKINQKEKEIKDKKQEIRIKEEKIKDKEEEINEKKNEIKDRKQEIKDKEQEINQNIYFTSKNTEEIKKNTEEIKQNKEEINQNQKKTNQNNKKVEKIKKQIKTYTQEKDDNTTKVIKKSILIYDMISAKSWGNYLLSFIGMEKKSSFIRNCDQKTKVNDETGSDTTSHIKFYEKLNGFSISEILYILSFNLESFKKIYETITFEVFIDNKEIKKYLAFETEKQNNIKETQEKQNIENENFSEVLNHLSYIIKNRNI
jgi:hypothetical protein